MKKPLLLFFSLLVLCASAQVPLRGVEDVNKVTDNTLDSLDKVRQARVTPGSSRKGNNPVLFLIGNSNKYIKVGDGKDYFIFLTAKIPVGQLAPYDYCKQTVKDAILNKRKQDLRSQMEQQLLQEGVDTKKLIIYDIDE